MEASHGASQESAFTHGAGGFDSPDGSPRCSPPMPYTTERLEGLSRWRLQRLAKQRGIQANIKVRTHLLFGPAFTFFMCAL